MKKYISVNTYLLVVIIGCFMVLSTCTEDEGSDPDPNAIPKDSTNTGNDKEPDVVVIDPNAVSADLMLENASSTKGSILSFTQSADLKLDKDTLFFVEGFKNRIRILYPPTFKAGSLSSYLQVEGADEYFDVALDEEESTDTIGVLYVEFDVDDWELPLSFKVKIAPHDDSGTPIDEFEREVVVDKKGDLSCSPTSPAPLWSWIYTIRDGEIETAPGFGSKTETDVTGCCFTDIQASIDCISNGFPESEWKKLTGISEYSIDYEGLIFDGSEVNGELVEYIQNLDPSPLKSNFCSGDLAYIIRENLNLFWGDYSYNPSNGQVQFTNLESRETEVDLGALGVYLEYDKIFIRAEYLYEIISCHFLMETGTVEGSSTIRLFERRTNPKGWID